MAKDHRKRFLKVMSIRNVRLCTIRLASEATLPQPSNVSPFGVDKSISKNNHHCNTEKTNLIMIAE